MPADLPTSEKELQAKILRVAREFGWAVNHVHRAQVADGSWRTTCSPGWPDCLLVHPVWGRVLALELKSPSGRLTPQQKAWMVAWQAAARNAPDVIGAWVVKPSDWPMISRLLTRRTPNPCYSPLVIDDSRGDSA